jgi:hypothetical protein
MKVLAKMSLDCGRMGVLSGLFICEEIDLAPFVEGKTIYFGEVLGKHSEIELDVELGYGLAIVSRDQDLIDRLLQIFHKETLCGHNPLSYLKSMEESAMWEED